MKNLLRLTALMAVLFLCLPAKSQLADLEKPNIIFLVLDDMNDWAGFLDGHPQAETPNLDRLAQRGVLFTNAHCSATQCSPSRASFMSGKDPEYTNVYIGNDYDNSIFRNNFNAAFGNETVFTLPEIMKDTGGYYTTVINKIFHGKNYTSTVDIDFDGLNPDPCGREKSWSETISLPGADATPNDPADVEGFDKFEWGRMDDSREADMRDTRGLDEALSFIQSYIINPADFCNKPFFMGLGIFKPHLPSFAPDKYFLDYYNPDIYQVPYDLPYNIPANQFPPNGVIMPPQPETTWNDYDQLGPLGQIYATEYNDFTHDAFFQYSRGLSPTPVIDPAVTDTGILYAQLEEAYRAHAVMSYLATVKYMDAQVGRLLNTMEAYPEVYNNTVIVCIGDHGFGYGEKKHWRKVALWDKITRVPMIIVDPRKPANRVCNQPVSLIDVFPTILELSNTAAPTFPDGSPYLDGQSLVPLLDNTDLEINRPALTSVRLPLGYPDGGCFPSYSLKDDRFHYIRYQSNTGPGGSGTCDEPFSQFEEELYEIGTNREIDPNEWNNLGNDPAYQDVKDYLAQWLPGGPLYLSNQAGKARITHTSIDCSFNASSTSTFTAEVYGADGLPIALPGPDYTFTWTSNVLDSPLVSNSLTLDGSTIDFTGLSNITVALRVDHVSGYHLQDLKVLNVDPAPSTLFTVSLPEPNKAQVSLFFPASDNVVRSEWDFGDGYVSTETLPGGHYYTEPGNYIISHRAYYGDPDNLCFQQSDLGLFLATGPFSSGCGVPQWIDKIFTTSNRVNLTWGTVYGATSYEIRIRPQANVDGAWFSFTSTTADLVANGLDFGFTFEVQVRAICTSGTGEWSYPYTFQTESCLPPRNIEITNLTSTTATVRWNTEFTSDHFQFIYKRPGIVTLVKTNLVNQDTFAFTGLTPNKTYYFALRQNCEQIDGTFNIKGELTEIFSFRTPVLRGSTADLPGSISLYPNPADDQINLQYEGASSGATDLLVFDAFGRLVLTEKLTIEQGIGSINLDVEGLPVGSYFVELQNDEGLSIRKKLLIQR